MAKEVLGGGKLATLGGAVAGAVAANALEKRHERYAYHLLLILLIIPIHGIIDKPFPPPPRAPLLNEKKKEEKKLTKFPNGEKKNLDIKTSAAAVFPIETIPTTTDIIVIITIIAVLLIHARLKMTLKINSPISSPPEVIMIPGRGVVVRAEEDLGGVVEDREI